MNIPTRDGKVKSRLRGAPATLPQAAVDSAERGECVVALWPGTKETIRTWPDNTGWERGISGARKRWPRPGIRITNKKTGEVRIVPEVCAVGILPGHCDKLILDIDSQEAEDWLEELADGREYETCTLFTSVDEETGFEKYHLVFINDTGEKFKTCSKPVIDGEKSPIDIRGWRGMEKIWDPSEDPEREFNDTPERPVSSCPWLVEVLPLYGERAERLPDDSSSDGQGGLWEAVLEAGDGFQRPAIWDWSLDAHDRGMTDDEILDRLEFAVDRNRVRPWHPSDPWDRAGLQSAAIPADGWRHTPNARHSEVEGIGDDELDEDGLSRITQNFGSVEDEVVEWVWPRYVARGVLTQLDGEKAQAKSFVMADLIARATRGLAMPGESVAVCDAMDVFLFAEDVKSQIRKRLQAAGADLSRVHFPHPEYRIAIMKEKEQAEAKRGSRRKRDRGEEVPSLLLPSGAGVMMRMIYETGAGLTIWDPITDYLDETISTGIDASVRRALDPVARGLEKMDVAGISLRHMNKDSKAAARYRGGGTTAFQNRARVHLVTGRLSDDLSDMGTFGLSMVDNNYVPRVEGTMAYDVIDSHIKLDNLGNMVGKIRWRGLADIDADTLSRGGAGDGKPGPDPIKRTAITEILNEMGNTSAKWDSKEAKRNIRRCLIQRGFSTVNDNTIDRAKREHGIKSKQGQKGWFWVWPENKISLRSRARARNPR